MNISTKLNTSKLIFFLILGTAFNSKAQNVTENKVTMSYIQLPTHVIAKQYSIYTIAVTRAYETANEDSLNLYQAKLESASIIYESELTSWKQVVKSMDRNYLVQMANWEKKTNAGTAVNLPVQPIYPLQPTMKEVEMPQLHSDFSDMDVDKAVKLEGFSKGAGGAVITIDVLPVSNIVITEKKGGSAAAIKYSYTCTYSLPIGVKIEVPGQGIVLQTIVSNTKNTYKMQSFSSKYEHQLWLIDNKEQFWIDLQKEARNSVMALVNTEINEKSGFPVKSKVVQVYTVKKFKDHSYTDLTNVYTIASQGYAKIGNSRDRKQANAKLLEAIASWKKILEQSTPKDSKSKINDKVTALLHCNIAQAYMWLSKFDEAELHINLAKNGGVLKFKTVAKKLENELTERRLRWNSYFG